MRLKKDEYYEKLSGKLSIEQLQKGEFYADYDEDCDIWGVFYTEGDGFCYSTWSDKESAQASVDIRNGEIKEQLNLSMEVQDG